MSPVRIKMCGMTREEDIEHAVALGVDALGLIFYPGSRRYISIPKAKKLLSRVPLFVDIVAVVVNPAMDGVREIINELPVQWLQFHGNESPDYCSQFKKPYIKSVMAISPKLIVETSIKYSEASAILLDTPSESYGGTGKVFDWDTIPKKMTLPFILAGGLDVSNIQRAVTQIKPYAVDVCSGIEQSPGIKDHNKMTLFVNAIRGGVNG